MKLKKLSLALTLSLGIALHAQAQRPDKLYSMSGIGTSIPIGESADFLKPKISTTLGANIGLGEGGLFLYPKLNLHAFKFNQQIPDEGYTYNVQGGRSTTYLLNLALGYRKIVNKWGFYGFAGGGGGFVLTPQAAVTQNNLQVTMNNRTIGMGVIEAGAGVEYSLGGVNLFIESSYMRGLSKIQDRTFNTVPVSFGIKPNLSKLVRKK
ncbi:hypothetical protein ACJVDH_11325 [Pedobacter sp. AW1-32]|uniref:hypothetical protein n=1 Tax=Pedobacter sp. AW1-32 TaxID=3383026 RepID=UPI003FF08CDF